MSLETIAFVLEIHSRAIISNMKSLYQLWEASQGRYNVGDVVHVDVAGGQGVGVVMDAEVVPGDESMKSHISYQIDLKNGNVSRSHYNEKGELWVNDYELKPYQA